MNEPSLENMMQSLMRGKEESFLIGIIIFTVLLLLLLLILFLINRFSGAWNYKSTVLTILAAFFIVSYACLLALRWYKYKNGYKDQPAWYGGIYEAYYQCTKCKSLSGGIFGKGPTKHHKTNSECVHHWQAIHKETFEEKYTRVPNSDKEK